MRWKLPTSRLRFGVGYFAPADWDFKWKYYEGKGLELKDPKVLRDPSFYSVACYFLSHSYLRGYAKGTYLDRKGPEPENWWEEQERRTIIRATLGARLQFPLGVFRVCVVPYAGGGGEYAYMLEDTGIVEKKRHGMGYEFFFGGTLVYRHAIGVFVEQMGEVISVGKDKVDIGGTSVMAGVEIWW